MDSVTLRERYVSLGRGIAFLALIIVIILVFNKTMNWDLAIILAMLAAGIILS